MPFHNPFIKDGRITFPEGASVVKHVERWAKVRGDKGAYRFLDFSTERDGLVRELRWAEFSVRNRAVAAHLQQVTQPGDRVAILCPQNLEYLVAFFGTLYSGRIAVPLFDPSEPGHVGRLHAVLDDCAPGDLICAAPDQAFNITNLPSTLDVLAGGAGQPVHAMYNTPQFWNLDGQTATSWTLNWARDVIGNAPHPKHG